jgi:hypothetical protein
MVMSPFFSQSGVVIFFIRITVPFGGVPDPV